ncbi:MAG TPA: helix-hairpin-helix domain-containing protein, partial [Anaerolineae bacterium]|nr:helix-hairpin-helix domain-containing protein [Anaerolineae bacterium]
MNGNHKSLVVNPNTADIETLTRIPGIGGALAQRIVSARPFETIEDMQKVNGIGSAFLERIR